MANPIFLQQLRQFNDPLTDNDLLLVKVKRRVNMPADEDMGVRYSKFIDQLQLGRFVQKAGDIMSGDLVFVNNRGIFGTTTSGATKSIFKLDNSDTVVVGSVTQTLKLATKDLIKANVNGTERVVYHSGNSNLATVDWRAKNIIADQTLWVNGESTFGNVTVRKLSAIYGYDAGNLKVRMIGIDDDDDVAVGVTTKRFGILVKDPNEIWAVQEEGNPSKQWRVLTTGNFATHLNGSYVLKTQTVNGKPLVGNITLTPSDVGALSGDDNSTPSGDITFKYGFGIKGKNSGGSSIDLLKADVTNVLIGSSILSSKIISNTNPTISVNGVNGVLYSTLNKPNKTDVGLSLIENYPVTKMFSSPNDNAYVIGTGLYDLSQDVNSRIVDANNLAFVYALIL